MREAWISAALVAALALTAAPLAAQQRARPTSALVVACSGTLAKDSNHLKLATAFDSKNVRDSAGLRCNGLAGIFCARRDAQNNR
jgi:anti-sigma-K factor RskA